MEAHSLTESEIDLSSLVEKDDFVDVKAETHPEVYTREIAIEHELRELQRQLDKATKALAAAKLEEVTFQQRLELSFRQFFGVLKLKDQFAREALLLEQKLEMSVRQFSGVKKQRDQLGKEFGLLRSERDTFERKIADDETRFAKLEKDKYYAREAARLLEVKLKQVEKKHSEELALSQAVEKELHDQVRDLESEKKRTEEDASKAQETLLQAIEFNQQKIARLKTELESSRQETFDLVNRNYDIGINFEQDIDDLKHEIGKKNESIASLSGEIERLTEEKDKQTEELRFTELQNVRLLDENRLLMQKLTDLQAKHARELAELKKTSAEVRKSTPTKSVYDVFADTSESDPGEELEGVGAGAGADDVIQLSRLGGKKKADKEKFADSIGNRNRMFDKTPKPITHPRHPAPVHPLSRNTQKR